MKNLLLLLALFASLTVSAFTTEEKENLKKQVSAELAKAKTPGDSVRLLYDLFDLSTRKEMPAIGNQIFETAGRAGADSVQYDIIRQLTACYTEDRDFAALEKRLWQMPRTRERDESIVFLKMKRMSYRSKYASEEQRQKDLRNIIARMETRPSSNKYSRLLDLYTIVEYLRNDPQSAMLSTYLDSLVKLVNSGKFNLYAIANIVYTEAANIYSDQARHDLAIKADKKVLDVIAGLERKYDSMGRRFRNYDISRYVSYRRIIRNYPALKPGEVKHYRALIGELATRNGEVAADVNNNPRLDAYYMMATENYAGAIPVIKQLLAKEKSDAVKIKLYDMLSTAARKTGDHATLVSALDDYNKLLVNYMRMNAAYRYQQLQIYYDVDKLKHEKMMLEIATRDQDLKDTRRVVTIMVIIWVVLAVVLLFSLYYWKTFKINSQRLQNLAGIFANERDKRRDSYYQDEYPSKSAGKFVSNSSAAHGEKKVNKAECSICYSTGILNDIAYISSIGRVSGKKSLVETDAASMLRDAYDNTRRLFSPGVKVDMEYPQEKIPMHVDRECLLYVLGHILRNVAEHSHEGEVSIGCRLVKGLGVVNYEVRVDSLDYGRGSEDLLFEDFVTLDMLVERRNPGLFYSRLLSFLQLCDIRSIFNADGGGRITLSVPVDMAYFRKPVE